MPSLWQRKWAPMRVQIKELRALAPYKLDLWQVFFCLRFVGEFFFFSIVMVYLQAIMKIVLKGFVHKTEEQLLFCLVSTVACLPSPKSLEIVVILYVRMYVTHKFKQKAEQWKIHVGLGKQEKPTHTLRCSAVVNIYTRQKNTQELWSKCRVLKFLTIFTYQQINKW